MFFLHSFLLIRLSFCLIVKFLQELLFQAVLSASAKYQTFLVIAAFQMPFIDNCCDANPIHQKIRPNKISYLRKQCKLFVANIGLTRSAFVVFSAFKCVTHYVMSATPSNRKKPTCFQLNENLAFVGEHPCC